MVNCEKCQVFPTSPRYLQENRVACEMGLYYVLHIAKLRNKNALQRLLPGLGEYCSFPDFLFLHDSFCSMFLLFSLLLKKWYNLRLSLLPPQWKPTMTWPLGTSSCTCWLDTSHCSLMSLDLKSFVPLSLMASFWLLFPGRLILSVQFLSALWA